MAKSTVLESGLVLLTLFAEKRTRISISELSELAKAGFNFQVQLSRVSS